MSSEARRRAERAGQLCETATVAYLLLKGFRPLGRRVKTPVGEIDIVARRGATVAFVEVKLRRNAPDFVLSATNRRRIAAAAKWWLAANPSHAQYTLRFDVVIWHGPGWPRHIPAAFDAEP
ncbi:YraN family protein [Lutibaculum baratangense]|uniref:UPF0102 protein N177_1284 n=1 Tax=Lutibaculum baratangense AMV1 TaxID=631454 RepID=V4RKX6_9HYPH|nr:YraN family protein [Lutibaculum baratangense]ESR25949.1 protein of unknown function UPF0102 [Lutibaculum baratangense AMV1]